MQRSVPGQAVQNVKTNYAERSQYWRCLVPIFHVIVLLVLLVLLVFQAFKILAQGFLTPCHPREFIAQCPDLLGPCHSGHIWHTGCGPVDAVILMM